ncbi:hypothetical protein EHN07_11090 [Buttiauxella warmboldiae]|uniref:Uncharacterized protein n=1 Tax=Buttiauxella warmboldiae TaxID=82993 RepID=A0A3N5DY10_9ENTR|nr:hypothetical protein EHN07_11090 [Buttiauxella warmboldiae]
MLLLFRDGETGAVTATFVIPEVLIGENSGYVVKYNSFAPTCADAQVFFSRFSTTSFTQTLAPVYPNYRSCAISHVICHYI